MLETHITMSLLIFHLILILVLHLISLMDLTITHMVLVHKRIALYIDALVMTHVLIVVIVSRIGMVFLLEVSHTRFKSRHMDGPYFPRRGSRPTGSNLRCKRL
jgi:hypothetical protein